MPPASNALGLHKIGMIKKTSLVRILVVDDFKPWLSFINTMLAREVDLQIVGFASDGRDAVAQAQALQPDLILMDISLPTLSGIEATRQIMRLVPKAKVIFVSQHREPVVARTALAAGGRGYLIKMDAGRELLSAVEAVVQGKRYLSSGLSGVELIETPDA